MGSSVISFLLLLKPKNTIPGQHRLCRTPDLLLGRSYPNPWLGRNSPDPLLGHSSPDPPLPGRSSPDPPLPGHSAPDPPLPGRSSPDPPLPGRNSPDPPLPGHSAPRPSAAGTQRPLTSVPATAYAVNSCSQVLQSLELSEQLQVLSILFSSISKQDVPSDFLCLTASGMQNLSDAGRSNTIYQLAQGLGTSRSDGSDSLLPVRRMPMGLIEYATVFFTASSVQKVHVHVQCHVYGCIK